MLLHKINIKNNLICAENIVFFFRVTAHGLMLFDSTITFSVDDDGASWNQTYYGNYFPSSSGEESVTVYKFIWNENFTVEFSAQLVFDDQTHWFTVSMDEISICMKKQMFVIVP